MPAVDVDVIEARAAAAPDVACVAGIDRMWVGFFADGDDERDGDPSGSGRWIAEESHYWHLGSEYLPPEFWDFHACARADVLTLAAENRRLRSALAVALGVPPLKAAA
jgi:hypothetical protein